ncbi:MAG: helix-turn-helix domain-containing protein [Clostridia bacterium]|jgi:transcriptional regulator with XRE-family HTH domain|nr:helix-turn-helix domain-containing protein [Clostridia bacterium]
MIIDIGENIKNIRKSLGKTQTEIAQLGGFTQGLYAKWENNLALPGAENLIKLAECLECSVDYILGRESEDNIVIINNKQKSEIEELYEKLDRQNKIMVLGYITALLQKQNSI